MRLPLILAALLAASPAAAQQAPAQALAPVPELPPEIASGAIVDQMQPVFRALANAFLNLPIGEIEAAVENRPMRPEDRSRTVGQASGMSQQELDREIATSSGTLKAGGQAMVRALPAITRALNEAGEEIGKAVNNLPSPAYPKR